MHDKRVGIFNSIFRMMERVKGRYYQNKLPKDLIMMKDEIEGHYILYIFPLLKMMKHEMGIYYP